MYYEPYSYWRNVKEKRVFLLAECPTEIAFTATECWLIEWGKTRDQAIKMPVEKFKALVDKRLIELFTPTYIEQ